MSFMIENLLKPKQPEKEVTVKKDFAAFSWYQMEHNEENKENSHPVQDKSHPAEVQIKPAAAHPAVEQPAALHPEAIHSAIPAAAVHSALPPVMPTCFDSAVRIAQTSAAVANLQQMSTPLQVSTPTVIQDQAPNDPVKHTSHGQQQQVSHQEQGFTHQLQQQVSTQRHVSPTPSPVPSSSGSTERSESPGDIDGPRRKKARTSFTNEQVAHLEHIYTTQRYLAASDRHDLARALHLTDQQVKTWFQNRRMKEKRQIKDVEDRLGGTTPPGYGVAPSIPAGNMSTLATAPYMMNSSIPSAEGSHNLSPLTAGGPIHPAALPMTAAGLPVTSSGFPTAAAGQDISPPLPATVGFPGVPSLPSPVMMSAAPAATCLPRPVPISATSTYPVGAAGTLPPHYPYPSAAPVDYMSSGLVSHLMTPAPYAMGQAIL